MSNDKMRGELLAAFEAHKAQIAKAMIGGGERARVRQVLERVSLSDFEAGWQASREALVIELPPEPAIPEDPEEAIDDSHMDAYHSAIDMRHACANLIKAAGVKVAK